ncbi:MAG: serine/threonine protein kinase [Myxococcales bacterium]|nr:serine/threonine protein kinase [Myxococcales bacterium]
MQLESGVVVAEHYRLEELVGRGGMGAVWRATDLRLGRVVAMKILHTDLRDDPSLRERFQREARLLASIDHPAIVPIYHLGVIEDGPKQCPCIVMPFVKGKTLAEAIARQGKFTVEQAVPIMRSLLDALGVAHATGVVHRDLKPHNVVLEDRGGSTVVRLLDFGIAKNVAATPTAGSVLATRAGMLLGTPEYMSPEQIRDPSTVDGRADLWAIGVMLYEMLTGRMPFEGTHQVEIIAKVMSGTPTRASEVNPALSPQVDQLFAKLFDRSIDGRFRTALQLSEALSALSGNKGEPVPFAWGGGSSDPSAKNPGVMSASFNSLPAVSVATQDTVIAPHPTPTPTPLPSIPALSAITATPVSTTNSYDSPEVKSIPMLAEATKQPDYFGAVSFGAQSSAIVPVSTPSPNAHAPQVQPSPATTTQSGRTLTIVALLIPVGFLIACALTIVSFARC